MPLKFRKSIKVAPGVKINLGKKSASISVGGKGFHHTVSTTGRSTTTVSAPGTGVSYTHASSAKKGKSRRMSTKNNTQYVVHDTPKKHVERNVVREEVLDENVVSTCPNCGATVRGSVCPYCETPLDVGIKVITRVEEKAYDMPNVPEMEILYVPKETFRKKHPIIFWMAMLCIWPFALGYWFYKTDKINLSKRTKIIILIIFYILIFAMGGSQESESSTTIDKKEYPKIVEEKKIENPLMKISVKEETVYSGSGENIGKRAYVSLSEDDFNKLDDSQIAEFVLSTVKKYENQKYNYFTIDFGNKRGVVFPGCNTLAGNYGQIDDTGSIELSEKYLMVSDSGEVSWEKVSKEEIDEQKQEIEDEKKAEQEKLVQERQAKYDNEIVYVSARGIYHNRSNCSNMKYFTEMTRKEAIGYGYKRCEKC